MRPLKSKRISKSNIPKRKRPISTPKVSNIFQTKKFIIELWQLLFLSSSSIFLIFTFSNQAWRPINFEQTKISGLSGITKQDIKKNTRIFFPKNLLELSPKEIEYYLRNKLPIKNISVSRSFFPP